ncbi:hypothetical protein [Halomonas sp. BM-2019]|uniref:hypothetical protein n=1 Tax=Halomonas sp. BM-2019 TaxID=2811227 RepID=UPI001B3C40EF|nr:MAG: hypothetical protein J5F18_07815 [Halomonas sp. BM-2019]
MKAWYRWCGLGLLLVLLAGCGGNGNEAVNDEATDETEVAADETEPEPEPTVEPFTEPVSIEFSATLRSDRRLMVEGESNLPESTRFQIVVERELSGVRWQQRTTLQDGRFGAGPFGPGSGLPDGGYTITVNLPEASVQPLEVRQRIGEQGEHLSGPLVGASRHGLGQVASTSRRFLVGSEPRRTTDRVEVLTVD